MVTYIERFCLIGFNLLQGDLVLDKLSDFLNV